MTDALTFSGLGRGAVWGTFSAADGVSSSGSGDDLEERVEPVSAADPLLASGLFRQDFEADTGRCLVCVASVGESCPHAEQVAFEISQSHSKFIRRRSKRPGVSVRSSIGRWCNGSTAVFGTACHGSNPCRPVPCPPVPSRLARVIWSESFGPSHLV